MNDMAKTKVSSRAQHPDRMQTFLSAIEKVVETFDDQISSLDDKVKGSAYKNFLNAYKEALMPVWNLARFADVKAILRTIADKHMTSLATMARKLEKNISNRLDCTRESQNA